MSRSLKKGPYVDPRVVAKLAKVKPGTVIKTWARASTITPAMVGHAFGVHNGKEFTEVKVREEMVGHRLGEFSPTTRFSRHGGKIQKDIEQKQGAAEAAPVAPAGKKK